MEDVGRVRVQVAACGDFFSVFWRVAPVVDWIVGLIVVLLLARSARFLHAVAEWDSCGVRAGPSFVLW